jgi:hypothetical protein
MEKLRPEEEAVLFNEYIRQEEEEFSRVVKQYDVKCEKDGMFDAYQGVLPVSPDNTNYMKGYNSVKK